MAGLLASFGLLLLGCGIQVDSTISLAVPSDGQATTSFAPPTTVPSQVVSPSTTTTAPPKSPATTTTAPPRQAPDTQSARGSLNLGARQPLPTVLPGPGSTAPCTADKCPVEEPLMVGIAGSITLAPLEVRVKLHGVCSPGGGGNDHADNDHADNDHAGNRHDPDDRDSDDPDPHRRSGDDHGHPDPHAALGAPVGSPPSSEVLAQASTTASSNAKGDDRDDDDGGGGHRCQAGGGRLEGTFGPILVTDNRGTLAGWTVFMALDDFASAAEQGVTIVPGVPQAKKGTLAAPPDPPQQPKFKLCDDIGCFGVLMAAAPGTGAGGWMVTGQVIVDGPIKAGRDGTAQVDLDFSLTHQFDDVNGHPH